MSEAYGSNNPSLDARLQGIPKFTATASGISTHEHVFEFDCKFNGIEVYSTTSSLGDSITIETQYNAGPYGWKRYKRFSKNWNVIPNDKSRVILFPTEPKSGLKLVIKYDNKSDSAVDFVVNLFQFIDQASVNPSQLEEGEDW